MAILIHRHRNQGLLLSELGGYLLGPERGRAGTKRISNLIHSDKWKAKAITDFCWRHGTQRVREIWAQGERPLPSGLVQPEAALRLGLALSIIGVGWALILDPLYGSVVFAGLFFDVLVYTVWLKRRSAWSIAWGGISGGMPILAGRALGVGSIDWIGIMLAASVLFWIPTHIMTFNIRYLEDYQRAKVPTFAERYGIDATRKIIATSSALATIFMGLSAFGIGTTIGYLRIMVVLSVGLLILALSSAANPSDRLNFGLFKYASLYMLSLMFLISM